MVNRNAGIGSIVYGKPPDILSVTALGSCIGVIIYDPLLKISGLGHIALPYKAQIIRKNLDKNNEEPGKYADTAIPAIVNTLKKEGALKLVAKMAGGSGVFGIKIMDDDLHIGLRNANAVVEELKKYHIPVISEDVGGKFSRTLRFFTESSLLEMRKTTTGKGIYDYETTVEFL